MIQINRKTDIPTVSTTCGDILIDVKDLYQYCTMTNANILQAEYIYEFVDKLIDSNSVTTKFKVKYINEKFICIERILK